MLLLFSLYQILSILKAWGTPQLTELPSVIRALAQRHCVRSLWAGRGIKSLNRMLTFRNEQLLIDSI
jgi:hypothetical protein